MTEQSRQDEAAAFYEENYWVIFLQPLSGKKDLCVIQDPPVDGQIRCRFCGRTVPQVTFRNTAHAVPEFLGNKRIMLRNECDSCNAYFSSQLEDHLANWFGPLRTVSQIKGKRGVPSYKSPNGTRIDVEETGPVFRVHEKPPEIGSKPPFELSFKMPRPKHVPLFAAKCLVKAACSVIPSEELGHFAETMKWLLYRDHPDQGWSIDSFPVMYSFVPGPNPLNTGLVILLRRKPHAESVPYMFFVLATANHCFQVFIPFCTEGPQYSATYNLCHFPLPFPPDYKYGKVQHFRYDWASILPTVSECQFSLHIDDIKEGGP